MPSSHRKSCCLRKWHSSTSSAPPTPRVCTPPWASHRTLLSLPSLWIRARPTFGRSWVGKSAVGRFHQDLSVSASRAAKEGCAGLLTNFADKVVGPGRAGEQMWHPSAASILKAHRHTKASIASVGKKLYVLWRFNCQTSRYSVSAEATGRK